MNFLIHIFKEEDVINSSSLDFDNKELRNYYKINPSNGFLKIKCKAPLMLKHIFAKNDILSSKEHVLKSGQKYYVNIDYNQQSYTFDQSLFDKDLQIKVTIFGLEPEQYINFYFNLKSYKLTNEQFVLNFTCTSSLFRFYRVNQEMD